MSERHTRTESWRAGSPLTVGSVTLLPIEHVVVNGTRGATGAWFTISKEPYAFVVRDESGMRMIATGAGAVSLDELREKVPELETLLAAI